jgi:hypothetical protein
VFGSVKQTQARVGEGETEIDNLIALAYPVTVDSLIKYCENWMNNGIANT